MTSQPDRSSERGYIGSCRSPEDFQRRVEERSAERSREIERGVVDGRLRKRIVTRMGPGWVRQAHPGWEIIDSDDGLTDPDGTSYLLERR